MKWTTSWASAASKLASGKGSDSAGAWTTETPRVALLICGDEVRHRVNGADVVGAKPAHKLCRQGARTAANVQHLLTSADLGEAANDGASRVE
jgi:hypothetical protein